ncbi:MAG TPA: hypothetical protein VNU49_09765 [Opitutaceae bacterium]|jgi:hypothetical protein|nr:hypothetical protein [Opitutaceae bacterium]
MLSDTLQFLLAVKEHWEAYVGEIMLLGELLELFITKMESRKKKQVRKPPIPRWILLWGAVIFLFIACFQTWREEKTIRLSESTALSSQIRALNQRLAASTKPPSGNSNIEGNENTVTGNVNTNIRGNGNTYMGPTNGTSSIYNTSMVVGHNATVTPGSIIVGAGAGAHQTVDSANTINQSATENNGVMVAAQNSPGLTVNTGPKQRRLSNLQCSQLIDLFNSFQKPKVYIEFEEDNPEEKNFGYQLVNVLKGAGVNSEHMVNGKIASIPPVANIQIGFRSGQRPPQVAASLISALKIMGFKVDITNSPAWEGANDDNLYIGIGPIDDN